ncbi:signal peptidase I [Natronocalculus amylovorans]|uniref:Signal peptidase I n=1 Tax=Natronocalculus amylovorans TaxID=2917812 RepID=A0AAE3FZM1_9EURY|nr:signal peptidase I [Natronocalculus amylovorans]MCL9817820.1 signal peptidase I [Natronocalculus amylovorans]
MNIQIKKIANIVAVLLLIAVVAPFVVYAAPWTIGADHSFVVLTASMTPAIAPGDVVIVADRGPETIVEGDVITFMRGTSEVPVTHRVVDVVAISGEPAFQTQGDANSAVDAGFVLGDTVLGTVIFTIPYIGYIIQFGNSTYGFIALVIVPFGLLILSELWTLAKKLRHAPESTFEDEEQTAGVTDPTTAQPTPSEAQTAIGVVPAAGSDGSERAPTNDGDGTVSISSDMVLGATIVLVPFVVYSMYLLTVLRTGLTTSVAVAALLLLLMGIGTIITTRRKHAVPQRVTDGGVEPDTQSVHTDTESVGLEDSAFVSADPIEERSTEKRHGGKNE